MTPPRALQAGALLIDLVGAAGVLLLVGRGWQQVVIGRQPPLADATATLSGRDLQPAIAACGIIALAGVLAIPATRRLGRQLVGIALVVCAGVIGWRAALCLSPMPAAQARASIVSGVGIDAASVAHVRVSATEPVLVICCAVLIGAAGLLAMMFASRQPALASRYDAPTKAAQRERGADDIALWTALDRGDDPTTRTQP